MDEIRGLTLFGEHFKGHQDQYILIGGVASWITMDEAGEDFRATKDLDIVLIIETLTPAFVDLFWEFIKSGQYEIRQTSEGKPVFYRFQKPANANFPCRLSFSPALLREWRIRKMRMSPEFQTMGVFPAFRQFFSMMTITPFSGRGSSVRNYSLTSVQIG